MKKEPVMQTGEKGSGTNRASKKKVEFHKALKLTASAITVYMINYLFRNLLSVATPLMLETGQYTKESIALLSSAYMVAYAAGQLVNGTLGDYIRPRLMLSVGLAIAGVGLVGFPAVSSPTLQRICFVLLGIGLSTGRGPLVKTVSENCAPAYARICCTLLSVISFLGPLTAGLVAVAFGWNGAFTACGISGFVFAAGVYLLYRRFEKKGITVPLSRTEGKKKGDLFALFRTENFIIWFLLSMDAEIMSTSISFWVPTYLTEHLSYTFVEAGAINSGMSLFKALSAFLCLGVVVLFHDNCLKMIAVVFPLSALLYFAMIPVQSPAANVALFTAARMISALGSSAMWTVYIPSLAKTGKVSGANGLLDFSGYITASAANVGLSVLIGRLGWGRMPLVFGIIPLVGAGLCIIGLRRSVAKKEKTQ